MAWQICTPKECPVRDSDDIAGVAFTDKYETYTDADTWCPSWAADGTLYSPYTDGEVTPGRKVMSQYESTRYGGGQDSTDCRERTPETGQAKIVGEDPFDLEVVNLGATASDPLPYGGRYPCGSLVYDDVWYYGTYCLDQHKYNWDTMGPFVGFGISEDYGQTWTDCPHTPLPLSLVNRERQQKGEIRRATFRGLRAGTRTFA